MSYTVLVRVSIAVKRYHGHGNSFEGNHLFVVAYSSEVQSIIIAVGHGNMQADILQEEEWRVPPLDLKAMGSRL